ncbi:MAG: T9SS type A sorting domain-containing protein, partial [Nanoarchaeota archaeon]
EWIYDHEQKWLKLNVCKNDTFYSDSPFSKNENDLCYWFIEDIWFDENEKRNVLYYWDYLTATIVRLIENIGLYRRINEGGGTDILKGCYVNNILFGDTLTNKNSIEKNKEIVSSDFLITAYPNPFNSTIVIKYILQKPSIISIKITNLLGQEVYNLNNNDKISPGTYSFAWQGVNNRGNKVTSGIYFIVISDGTSIKTKKIMFLQ